MNPVLSIVRTPVQQRRAIWVRQASLPGGKARHSVRGEEGGSDVAYGKRRARSDAPYPRMAFTLLELLVVISIIGILAALTAPAITNMRKGDSMSAGVRQLLDAVSYARQRAIGDHTTVYMVFVPPVLMSSGNLQTALNPAQREQFLQGQMRSYAIFVKRQAGDQPGRGRMRYITPWRSLPDGVVIAQGKFDPNYPLGPSLSDGNLRIFDYANFPFPDENGPLASMPYLEFDYSGSLQIRKNLASDPPPNATIPLTRGSLMPLHSWGVDFREQPVGFSTNSFNHIIIDRLTGRARHETRRFQ